MIYYDGNFLNDKCHGFGKLYNNGILMYEGNFLNNEIEGKGKRFIDNSYIKSQMLLILTQLSGKASNDESLLHVRNHGLGAITILSLLLLSHAPHQLKELLAMMLCLQLDIRYISCQLSVP